MPLPLRITFNDKDYTYQLIDKHTTAVMLILDGEKIELIRDTKLIWKQQLGSPPIDEELIQALGRSVSLQLRM